MSKERPILFNGAMVRAILSGQKTQTRRAAKGVALDWLDNANFTPAYVADPGNDLCPFGQPGDRLWVRETWRPKTIHSCAMDVCDCDGVGVTYAADGEWIPHTWFNPVPDDWCMPKAAERGNVPAIHMPRWACRLVLEITAVRVERLQDVSAEDCIAEGLTTNLREQEAVEHLRRQWQELWTSTGGDWDSNPWVWVIEFKVVKP